MKTKRVTEGVTFIKDEINLKKFVYHENRITENSKQKILNRKRKKKNPAILIDCDMIYTQQNF